MYFHIHGAIFANLLSFVWTLMTPSQDSYSTDNAVTLSIGNLSKSAVSSVKDTPAIIIQPSNIKNCSVGFIRNDCEQPCRYPSFGVECQMECSCSKDYCHYVGGCNKSITDACPKGRIGANCSISCRYPGFGNRCQDTCNCNQSECDHVKGCIEGSETIYTILQKEITTQPFIDRQTSKKCSSGFFGANCTQTCRFPSFGDSCQMECHCNEKLCHFVFGCNVSLPDGVSECTPGYMGEGCKQKCRYPSYGIGCQSQCSCVESSCDHILGCNISEWKQCHVGYKEGNCEQPCEFPSFGEDCQKKCNCTHEKCDHISGCMFENKPNCLRKNEAIVAKNYNILFTSVIILSSIALIMALFYVCILCKTQNKAIHNMNQQISISAHQRHINLYEIINI
uniref:Multiple epidermal growth factor-like domains protein 6 n=1 Tax=Crassostrea virginica TaxID=6565 RepID=A0A8B8AMA3_CRAVI|nr:multiple epidermal growth factor-like domains protein 6 [Crassostrea virginica]